MANKTFRSRRSAKVVAALALLSSTAAWLLYAGEQRGSDAAGLRLVAAVQAQSSESMPSSTSSQGDRPIRINRAPLRVIKNSGTVFSAVAVDPTRNEIVLQDEADANIIAQRQFIYQPLWILSRKAVFRLAHRAVHCRTMYPFLLCDEG